MVVPWKKCTKIEQWSRISFSVAKGFKCPKFIQERRCRMGVCIRMSRKCMSGYKCSITVKVWTTVRDRVGTVLWWPNNMDAMKAAILNNQHINCTNHDQKTSSCLCKFQQYQNPQTVESESHFSVQLWQIFPVELLFLSLLCTCLSSCGK